VSVTSTKIKCEILPNTEWAPHYVLGDRSGGGGVRGFVFSTIISTLLTARCCMQALYVIVILSLCLFVPQMCSSIGHTNILGALLSLSDG